MELQDQMASVAVRLATLNAPELRAQLKILESAMRRQEAGSSEWHRLHGEIIKADEALTELDRAE